MMQFDVDARRLLTEHKAASNFVGGAPHFHALPTARAVADALRRNPDALSDPSAAVRRAAIAAASSSVSLKELSAAFAAAASTRRRSCEGLLSGFPRFRAEDVKLIDLPLRQVFDTHRRSVDLARLTGGRGAKSFDVEAARAERNEDNRHTAFDAAPAAAERISDVGAAIGDDLSDDLGGVARILIELSRRVDALQGRYAGLARRATDDDPLLAIGWVAKAFGKDAAALTKQAKRRGLHVFVGGRVHVRLSDVTKLYPAMSGSALLASALARCEARAKWG